MAKQAGLSSTFSETRKTDFLLIMLIYFCVSCCFVNVNFIESVTSNLNHVMRKPVFGLCENKDADQRS